MTKAIDDVLAERHIQAEAEGFDAKHDDKYHDGELCKAAACYIFSADRGASPVPPIIWPWDIEWWKPKNPRRDLVRAAAMLIAEIERLDRADGPKPIYLHDWAEGGEAEMLKDFGIDKSALEGAEIIVASYTYECYEGSAFVLFRRDGKLFAVYGGHCSCYGLSESDYSGSTETQWQPEETSFEALMQRIPSAYDPGVHDAIVAAMNAERRA